MKDILHYVGYDIQKLTHSVHEWTCEPGNKPKVFCKKCKELIGTIINCGNVRRILSERTLNNYEIIYIEEWFGSTLFIK